MQSQLNALVRQILDTPADQLPANKSLIDQLVKLLCHITNIDLHPDIFLDEHATQTIQGKAVSMTTAAQCAEEYMRTQVFLRGVHQAISEQLTHQQPLEILYAGTGPFGLLIVPLLSLFSAEKIQVTLLDLHPESLQALKKVIAVFDVQDRIKHIECTDILQWHPAQNTSFNLIVSETMKAMLVQEPQVSIFAHLRPYLATGGSLIPQQIRIEGWLISKPKSDAPLPIGEIFTLNKQSALELNQQHTPDIQKKLRIPQYNSTHAHLKFTTTIQVYGEHWLHENQCSLNLPHIIYEANPVPNSPIQCHYRFGKYPGFEFDYPRKPEITDQPLPAHSDRSLLGLPHLNRIWHKTQQAKQGKLDPALCEQEWLLDRQLYDTLKLGLELAVQALFQYSAPQEFVDFILEKNEGSITTEQRGEIERYVSNHTRAEKSETETETDKPAGEIEPTLSKAQWAFWQQHGYLIIPGVLTREECQQTRDEICDFMGVSMVDPESWYKPQAAQQKIMVQLYNSPGMEHNRNKPEIYQIFAQLWKNDQLTISTDRVSFNPPETDTWKFPGPDIHWDIDFTKSLHFATQGLIYLTDTTENQGAFCCVPGFHQVFDQWRQSLPPGCDPQKQDWSTFDVKSISANAGDLIIWHQALPHGSSPNQSISPRIVQYINMYPQPGFST